MLLHLFVLPELSAFDSASREFSPVRVQLCLDLCSDVAHLLHLLPSPSRCKLATMADLGQFHTDAYLGMLSQFAQYHPASARQRATDEALLQDRLSQFNLKRIMDDALEYSRLVASGTLHCCEVITRGNDRFAFNLYGGQCQARRGAQHNGALVNDAVLAALYLLRTPAARVLFISLDAHHPFALEEAFYGTDRVITISLHGPNEPTGREEDVGVGAGGNTKFNLPNAGAALLSQLLGPIQQRFAPTHVIFVSSPSFVRGEAEYLQCARMVRALDLPTLVLGGTSVEEVAAADLYAKCVRVFLSNAAEKETLSMAADLTPMEEEMRRRVVQRLS